MAELPSVVDLAGSGDVDGLCRYLNTIQDINHTDNQCLSGFHVAYVLGHKKFIWKLLHSGFSLESVAINNLPFSGTVHLLCLPSVLFFKVYQETVKIYGRLHRSLFEAVYKRDLDATVTLWEKLLSTLKSHKNKAKYDLLLSALLFLLTYYKDCPENLFQNFIKYRADVDVIFHGYPICVFAILCNNEKCLKILLESGCSTDTLVNNVFSPFHYAIQLGHLECLSLLLNQDRLFRLKVWRSDGTHFLEYAVKHRQRECVNLLLRHGAKVNRVTPDPSNDSVLMLAVKHCDAAIVEVLLQYGANVDCANGFGERPLMHAALRGCRDCMELLISYGAEVNACDSYNESPLMHAIQRGNTSCVQSLLSKGADVSLVSAENHTALSYAIALIDPACLELLLASEQCRLDTQVLNQWHKEAFLFSLRQFNIRYLILLLEHNVFDWNWLSHDYALPTELVAKAVVTTCVSPGYFIFQDKIATLFQVALKRGDFPTANYLLANLYFTEQDFQDIRRKESFLHYITRNKKSENISQLVCALQSNTPPLQTLCLLTVSVSLNSLSNKRKRRRDLVNTLPIPDRFKTLLKFESDMSGVCVKEWKFLGEKMMMNNETSEKYCTLVTPWNISWKIGHDHCRKTDCCDDPAVYRRRQILLLRNCAQNARTAFPIPRRIV